MEEEKNKEAKAFSDNKKGISIDNWKMRIKEKLRIVKHEGSEDMIMSIFKVPNKLRKVKDDAYDYSPRVVSIGPFHQNNPDLAAMREHKWSYMLHFFQHIEDPQRYKKCWEECTNAIYGFDGKVRANYAEKIKYKVDELAEIMLLDGCFILDLFLRYEQHFDNKLEEHQSNVLFNNAWMLPALRHDLALLENQIPFFVLKKLYETIMPSKPPNSVNSLALKFFEMKQKPTKEEPEIVSECKHLLDLLHKFYVSTLGTNHISIPVPNELIPENHPSSTVNGTSSPHNEHDPSRKNLWGFSYGASQLLEAGIKFEKGQDDDHLLEITFKNGVIRIPPLIITETTFSLFRNLIAFEQCSLNSRHHMTSYVILMRSLIRSQRDINLFQKKYEIINRAYWISNQDILNQFRSIIENVVVKDFSYAMLRGEVDRYRKTRHWQKHKASWGVWLHKYIKDVHHKYFRTPWSIISFIAAVVLFFLTSLQTYFTIYPR